MKVLVAIKYAPSISVLKSLLWNCTVDCLFLCTGGGHIVFALSVGLSVCFFAPNFNKIQIAT